MDYRHFSAALRYNYSTLQCIIQEKRGSLKAHCLLKGRPPAQKATDVMRSDTAAGQIIRITAETVKYSIRVFLPADEQLLAAKPRCFCPFDSRYQALEWQKTAGPRAESAVSCPQILEAVKKLAIVYFVSLFKHIASPAAEKPISPETVATPVSMSAAGIAAAVAYRRRKRWDKTTRRHDCLTTIANNNKHPGRDRQIRA